MTLQRLQVIGKNRVAVPTHFFKVVLGETRDQKLEMQVCYIPSWGGQVKGGGGGTG